MRVEEKSEARGTRGVEGRKRRRRSIHRSASSPGVGRLFLRVPSLSLLLLLLFFITIFAFPTFCFMLMVAPCCYPLHQPLSLSFSLPRSPWSLPLPPIPSRRPSLRMHGLGELLAFCLEFKKFFHPPPPPSPTASSRRVAPRPPSRRTTLVVVVTYLFRFVSCTPTCALRSILSRKHKRGKI